MTLRNTTPPTYMLAALVVIAILHFLFPVAVIIPNFWNLTGIIPLILGVILNLQADRAFHNVDTTVQPFEKSNVLITDGVFRITRNPMYLGFMFVLLGEAVLFRTLSPYIVVLAFTIFIDQYFIREEERMMAEDFGADWETYKAQTRRWL